MRLSNIERVELLDRAFTRKRRFSLREYAERSFGVFQEEPFDVVWRFSPKAAADARQFLFHPTQTFEEQPDGSLIVRFRAGGALEMCWHLFTWGDQVEVLKPKRLQNILQEQVNSLRPANNSRQRVSNIPRQTLRNSPMAKKLIPLAIAYDFDGTLAPGNIQENTFIPAIGMTKKRFWQLNKIGSENTRPMKPWHI